MIIHPAHPAFTTPVAQLKGVGPKTLAKLASEGFFTTGDLLNLAPRFYQDRRQPTTIASLQPDEEAMVEVVVVSAKASYSPRTKRRYIQCRVEDDCGDKLMLVWFNFPGYLLKSLTKGRMVRVFGRAKCTPRGLEMPHPDLDFLTDSGETEDRDSAPEIRAVYPPIGELSSSVVKKLIDQVRPLLDTCPPLFPPQWLEKHKLNDPSHSLAILHTPPAQCQGRLPRPGQTKAFRNLAFFELLFWRLFMLKAKATIADGPPRSGASQGLALMKAFWQTLPFRLSPEQARVAQELAADLAGDRPMSRLLQGEVGGGKTAVAASALFFALGSGGQGALMAPTEVLARQHYDFLQPLAQALGYEIVLLTGGLAEKDKRAARAALAEGRAHLAVGSQALLSEATVFKNLSLAVIDEQHRFGVRQRLALRRKNERVDILAMSATPIPRSLALMLYGDLDSSSLKGLLPGRRSAETIVFQPGDRALAYRRFLELVGQGGQGFLVTPRIEGQDQDQENGSAPGRDIVSAGRGPDASEENREAKWSLDEIHAELQKMAGPSVKVGRLHGRMEAAERQQAMDDFRLGRSRILVATTIIEVGVDVPAARVILIEGAERFGLAQLHQLRGRVGRGGEAGYCLLLPSKAAGPGERRLQALTTESDGQALAELDLEMRGPGEQLGLRQSGWPALNFARLPQDLPLLAQAHHLAENIWAEQGDFWAELEPKLDFKGFEAGLAGELD